VLAFRRNSMLLEPKRVAALLALVLCPVVATPAAAQTSVACSEQNAEQPAVHGTVRDVYGRLMPNARVEVTWQEQSISAQERSERNGIAVDSTDAQGTFRVCAAPAPRSVITENGGRVRVISALKLTVSRGPLRSRTIEIGEIGATQPPLHIRIAADTMRTMAAGTVLDSLGRPLPGARIRVEGDSTNEAVTDAEGFFQLEDVPAATHQFAVRAIGYTPLLVTAASESGMDIHVGEIQLGPIPPLLDTVRVIATRETRLQRDFEERRRILPGTFLSEEEIAKLPALTPGFLVSRVSRMELVQEGPYRHSRKFAFRRAGPTGDSYCSPRIFLDGQDLRNDVGMDEIEVYLRLAKRIEVYRASFAPPQFTDFNGCGSVVIWTK
jgi:hypothetical protein